MRILIFSVGNKLAGQKLITEAKLASATTNKSSKNKKSVQSIGEAKRKKILLSKVHPSEVEEVYLVAHTQGLKRCSKEILGNA